MQFICALMSAGLALRAESYKPLDFTPCPEPDCVAVLVVAGEPLAAPTDRDRPLNITGVTRFVPPVPYVGRCGFGAVIELTQEDLQRATQRDLQLRNDLPVVVVGGDAVPESKRQPFSVADHKLLGLESPTAVRPGASLLVQTAPPYSFRRGPVMMSAPQSGEGSRPPSPNPYAHLNDEIIPELKAYLNNPKPRQQNPFVLDPHPSWTPPPGSVPYDFNGVRYWVIPLKSSN